MKNLTKFNEFLGENKDEDKRFDLSINRSKKELQAARTELVWVHTHCNVPEAAFKKITDRIKEINKLLGDPVAEGLNETSPPWSETAAALSAINKTRPLSAIAAEIRKDWKKVNYAAEPYLDAMGSLDSIKDRYYEDSGESVVAYFLSNASTWKGEVAKRIKAELNKMLKSK